mmetsp:Transcript_117591/g.339938  ORF Transcript_117591/g.339938 Transcript_117591/m.339938 type:complete len:114 (-) Transcript_117591:71-412(-)
MAKSKNHTGHNQSYKNHRNGIKKTRRPKKMSMSGMNCKFVRNQAYAKKGMRCTPEEKEERLKAQKEAQKKMEEKKATEKAQRLKELEEMKEAEKLKAANKQAKKDAQAASKKA